MAKTNQGIRQEQCTMETAAGLKATFNVLTPHGTVHVGKAVSITADGVVDLVPTNGELFGQLQHLEDDGMAAITDEGYVDLPTDGTSITFPGGLVGGATAGLVKAGASATCRAICMAGTNLVRAKLL